MNSRVQQAVETVQYDVEPGNKSGVYYIAVGNLPFDATWHDLKNFAGKQCVVDHTQVFGQSTSGWVRVLGRANFEHAWKRLNGGIFGGRALMAKHNATEPMKIRDVVGGPVPRGCPTGGPAPASAPTSSSASRRGGGSRGSAAATGGSAPMTSSSSAGPAPASTAASRPTTSYDGAAVYSAADNYQAAQYPTIYNYDSPYMVGGYHPSAHGSTETSAPVITEQRKLLIKKISKKGSSSAVKRFVRERSQPLQDYIQRIEIVTDDQGHRRGHAIMTLRSNDAAVQVQRKLNGLVFLDRRLEVQLAKEGIAEWPSVPDSRPPATEKMKDRGRPDKSLNYGASEASSSASGAPQEKKSKGRDNEKVKDKDKEKTKDKKEGRERGPPVIADGSSRRGSNSEDSTSNSK